ncbi:MAG: bifunctional nuclease domain-containing protein [Nitrososphaera sp.]
MRTEVCLKIDEPPDSDYATTKITYVGFVDPYGVEGLVILRSEDGKEFHMRAFSGEVARHITNFIEGRRDTIPTIYNMIEEIAELNELILVRIKVYESGSVLRANIYFTGKNEFVMRNYRASDAIALATFYNVPILVRKNLLKEKMEV